MSRTVEVISAALCAATISLTWIGCASVRLDENRSQERAETNSQAALVVFRITTTWDREAIDPLTLLNSKTLELRMAIASLDDHEGLRAINVEVSPLENENSRWCHLRLRPGTYFVQSLGPNLLPGVVRVQSIPAFWFIIPDSTPLLYIGTLRIDAAGELLRNRARYHQTKSGRGRKGWVVSLSYFGGSAGRKTVNVVPLPSSLSTLISPPIISANFLHSTKPNPVPPYFT